MQRLDALLEADGPPPQEVCLELAWQLQLLTEEDPEQQLAWQELGIDRDGTLVLLPSSSRSPDDPLSTYNTALHLSEFQSSASHLTARHIIDQLLTWSGCDLPTEEASDQATRLSSATLIAIPHPEPLKSRSSGLEQRTLAPKVASDAIKRQSSVSQLPPKTARRKDAQSRKPTPSRKLTWIGLSTVVGCLLAGWLWSTFTSGSNQKTETVSAESTRSQRTQPRRDTDASQKVSSKAESQIRAASGATTDTQPTLSSSLTTSDDLLLSQSTQVPDTLLSASDLSITTNELNSRESVVLAVDTSTLESMDSPSALVESGNATVGSAEETTASVGSSATTDAMGVDSTPNIDVMQELEKVAADSRLQEEESMFPDGQAADSTEPFSLAIHPFRSEQRVPDEKKLNVRQPNWQLRVAVQGEGVSVQPADVQVINGRSVATWRIELEEPNRPLTAVFVTAQLLNTRSTTIRWSVAAIAEDNPSFTIPLDRATLDALQQSLNGMNEQLSHAIDQLRAYSNSASLPTGARSLISQRRRELSRQLEIGQRFVQVIADANQLAGLLDGRIAIHAQLTDASKKDSTPLLQFGTLDASVAIAE